MHGATFARKRLALFAIAALISTEVQWIIVLGCRVRWRDGALQGPLGRRITRAAEVFHGLDQKGEAAQIVVTGGVVWSGERECDAMSDALLELRVPASRILTESHARTTRENAAYTAELLRPYKSPGDTFLLVTSDWHTRRAEMLFRAEDLPVEVRPAIDTTVYPRRLAWRARERLALFKDSLLVAVRGLRS